MNVNANAHKTAIARVRPSKTAKYVLSLGLAAKTTLLDYGCGKGRDVDEYNEKGLIARGYDPYWRREAQGGPVDVVTCSYVLNVIELKERHSVARAVLLHTKPGGRAIFTMRGQRDIEASIRPSWTPRADGYVTSKGTFQAWMSADALKALLEAEGFVEVSTWEKGRIVWADCRRAC